MKVYNIANCPEHGIHGERVECFVCGKKVEQIPMTPVENSPFQTYQETSKEIVMGHDFADPGQDKYYIQDVLEKLTTAAQTYANASVVEELEKIKLDSNGYSGDSAYYNGPFYVVPLSEIDDRITTYRGGEK